MQNNTFVSLLLEGLYVDTAVEYGEVGSRAPKHPYVVLKKKMPTKMSYTISNRYVLYNFLRRCDPSLRYDAFMQTVYDIPVGYEGRPSLKDMISGYIENTERTSIDIQVKNGNVRQVTDDTTYSKYFESTFDFIRSNFLPDYKMGTGSTKVGGKSYPLMTFFKTIDDKSLRIKIVSLKGKTHITGSVVYWTNINEDSYVCSLQPVIPKELVGWVHTLEAGLLNVILSNVDMDLCNFVKDANVMTAKQIKDMSGSGRLENFHDKNKLEREYYRKVIG